MSNLDFINPAADRREHNRRLAGYIRVAGIRGVSPNPLACRTASGRGTVTVRTDLAGLPPSDQPSTVDARDGGSFDMSKAARYASHYKGATFAKSMDRAASVRHLNAFRAMLPYWPTDASGALRDGRVSPRTGRRYFDIGSDRLYLDAIYAAWASAEGADAVADQAAKSARQSRDAELAALVAEQEADRAHDRKHSRRR